MKDTETTKIFENYTKENLTDEIREEIENNLKEFYEILLKWTESDTS